MPTTVLLISETYLRDTIPFNKNVDISDLVTNISPAQEMFLEPVLGTTFYDYIQVQYSAQTLTVDEITLMTYIKPFIAYKTAVITLPFLQYQIKNKGPQSQNGDNSSQVDNSVLFYLKKELENRAEWYDARLQRYLFLNQTLFPLYVTQGNVDLQPNRDSGYDAGFSTYNVGCGTPNCNGNFNGFFNRNGY